MYRYVIHPRSINITPKEISKLISEGRRLRSDRLSKTPSIEKDFFLYYPHENNILEFQRENHASILDSSTLDNTNTLDSTKRRRDSYYLSRVFSRCSKAEQRYLLSRGVFSRDFCPFESNEYRLPTPRTFNNQLEESTKESTDVQPGRIKRTLQSFSLSNNAIESLPILQLEPIQSELEPPRTSSGTTKFIVRPNTHRAGKNYRITEDPYDFQAGSEYIQEIFPKTHEYRCITVLGKPLILLKKVVPEGISYEQPWNHSCGSRFVTIPLEGSYLSHTDFFTRIQKNPIIKGLYLSGIDILYNRNDKTYVICEVNLTPSLQITQNLAKVAEYALSLQH